MTGTGTVFVENEDKFIFQLQANADGQTVSEGKAIWHRAQNK
jgi:hypothetical protein